jgi:prepilin-type N-terminal cleavage/methylation domain-containing protein
MLILGRKKTFTLLELLVVVAIIGILVTILLPPLRGARLSAKTGLSMSNLKQIYTATMGYASKHNGYMCLVTNNPTPLISDANWRLPIYSELLNIDIPTSGKTAFLSTQSYKNAMYCPVILEDRGGYPNNAGESRGHYGMNKYFGWSLSDEPNIGDGYKNISFAALSNKDEPFLMPTKAMNNRSSGFKLGGGDVDGGRSCPEYIYVHSKSIACMLDGSMGLKTISWGASMDNKLDDEENFE